MRVPFVRVLKQTVRDTRLASAAVEARLYVLAKRDHKFSLSHAPGHFYSPILSKADIDEAYQERSMLLNLHGIDLKEDAQLSLARDLCGTESKIKYSDSPQRGLRYRFSNGMFEEGDALVLHGMMRYFRPARVIEVGSGYSSALMLDTNDQLLNGRTHFTFIEPNPERLMSLLTPDDQATARIIQSRVQEVDPAIFDELRSHDFLFIDSSHVSKAGSDVNHLIFNILPQLRPGVIIHFHDVFWPFEYPKMWAEEGRSWNEDYLLRALLMYNTRLEILLFSSWLARVHPRELGPLVPPRSKEWLGSLWLRSVGPNDAGRS